MEMSISSSPVPSLDMSVDSPFSSQTFNTSTDTFSSQDLETSSTSPKSVSI
jgi:hypothetical protein